MKKINVIAIVILIFLSTTIIVHGEKTEERKNTETRELLYQDALLTILSDNISDAIVGHYGEQRNFHLFGVKILDIKRITESETHRTFDFEIKVEVMTWEEPTNKQGIETLLINISPYGVIVKEYAHRDI